MELTPAKVLIAAGVFALIALIGRLVALFRQSREIEKTLDYSRMRKWEDDDDWPDRSGS